MCLFYLMYNDHKPDQAKKNLNSDVYLLTEKSLKDQIIYCI